MKKKVPDNVKKENEKDKQKERRARHQTETI